MQLCLMDLRHPVEAHIMDRVLSRCRRIVLLCIKPACRPSLARRRKAVRAAILRDHRIQMIRYMTERGLYGN